MSSRSSFRTIPCNGCLYASSAATATPSPTARSRYPSVVIAPSRHAAMAASSVVRPSESGCVRAVSTYPAMTGATATTIAAASTQGEPRTSVSQPPSAPINVSRMNVRNPPIVSSSCSRLCRSRSMPSSAPISSAVAKFQTTVISTWGTWARLHSLVSRPSRVEIDHGADRSLADAAERHLVAREHDAVELRPVERPSVVVGAPERADLAGKSRRSPAGAS